MAEGTLSESELNEDNRESLDWSCIHWGYLNSAQLKDGGKRVKEPKWQTFWAELYGPTLQPLQGINPKLEHPLQDTSLLEDSSNAIPPSSIMGPTPNNQKKHSFFGLKMGEISVFDYEQQLMNKRGIHRNSSVPRRHVLKLSIAGQSEFLFQFPSKSSLYRWIQKMQTAVDNADKVQPLNERTLEEAKCLMAEELTFQENLSERKGSESSVDTSTDNEELPKPQENPKLLKLQRKLIARKELLDMIEQEEAAFFGTDNDKGIPSKPEEFQGTLLQDYFLVPGYSDSLVRKGQKVTIFGQLPNKRWKCAITLDESECTVCLHCGKPLQNIPFDEDVEESDCSEKHEQSDLPKLSLQLGSIPSSIIEELKDAKVEKPVETEIALLSSTPPDTHAVEVPEISSYSHAYSPDSPPEPYSPHRLQNKLKLHQDEVKARATSVSALEEFSFPSPPLTPPSTPPSARSSVISTVSTEDLDPASINLEGLTVEEKEEGTQSEDKLTPIVQRRDPYSSHRNLSIEIKGKLRARGISMIVGSSSSEDEDEPESPRPFPLQSPKVTVGLSKTLPGTLTPRMIQEEFKRAKLAENNKSSSGPMKAQRFSAPLSGECSSQSSLPAKTRLYRSQTLGIQPSGSGESYVLPPLNQRRTLQMVKTDSTGFGFSMQTFGIVQHQGDIECVTFVRSVEEDGPAYMAGLRQGDIIVEIEGEDVEDCEHKEIVDKINNADQNKIRVVVIFVNALKRMELNTKLKKLVVSKNAMEKQLSDLERLEKKLLKGDSLLMQDYENIEVACRRRPRTPPLHTMVRTSTFSTQTPFVREDVQQYKHTRHTKITKQTSVPQNQETITIGNELLKDFAVKRETRREVRTQQRKSSENGVSFDEKKKDVKLKARPPSFVSYVHSDQESSSSSVSSSRSSIASLNSVSSGMSSPFPSPSPNNRKSVEFMYEQPNEYSAAASIARRDTGSSFPRPKSLQHLVNVNFASSRKSFGSAGNLMEQGAVNKTNNKEGKFRSKSAENLDIGSDLLASFGLHVSKCVNPEAVAPTLEEKQPIRKNPVIMKPRFQVQRPQSYYQAMNTGNVDSLLTRSPAPLLPSTLEQDGKDRVTII